MTIKEKIGQLRQFHNSDGVLSEDFKTAIRNGQVGSVLFAANVDVVNTMQDIAMNESRLKIPIIIGRDIIHGYRTVLPIPLAQAASFNTSLVTAASRVAAKEGATSGTRWTFSPMMDISRDPRWGRIA